MIRMHLWIIAGSLAALLVAAITYSREAARKSRTHRRNPIPSEQEPTPAVAAIASASPEVRPPREKAVRAPLWEQLSSLKGGSGDRRQEAIQAIAAYLSVAPTSRIAFEEAALQSILDIDQAVAVRLQELSTPTPTGVSREVERTLSRDSDARFDAARRRALERMEPFLNRSGSHQEFRREFDTWAATLSAASRGIYR